MAVVATSVNPATTVSRNVNPVGAMDTQSTATAEPESAITVKISPVALIASDVSTAITATLVSGWAFPAALACVRAAPQPANNSPTLVNSSATPEIPDLRMLCVIVDRVTLVRDAINAMTTILEILWHLAEVVVLVNVTTTSISTNLVPAM